MRVFLLGDYNDNNKEQFFEIEQYLWKHEYEPINPYHIMERFSFQITDKVKYARILEQLITSEAYYVVPSFFCSTITSTLLHVAKDVLQLKRIKS